MNVHSRTDLLFCLNGVKLQAPSHIITPTIAAAINSGTYEVEEARITNRALETGDRVLEVGSGLGYITTTIARDSRVQSVTAYEADPRMAQYATDTLRRNGHDDVTVVNGMLGGEEEAGGFAQFRQRPDFWMSSAYDTDINADQIVSTPIYVMNDVLREQGISIIICDIEGAEVDLLSNADLSNVDRIVVELHDHITGLSGIARLYAAMADKGFVYDPRCSENSVVLFRRLGSCADKRPYGT
ncbi:MAG: FkbM family methyltransferase [Pikeienuella sp.]